MDNNNLISQLSHELRTPINGIVGLSELAKQNMDNPEKIRECVENITRLSLELVAFMQDIFEQAQACVIKKENGEKAYLVEFPYNLQSRDKKMVEKNVLLETKLDKYNFKDKNILIVDDNYINREITAELISMTGANIFSAINGKEALDKFLESKENFYHLILMDIQMDTMDGYTATDVIRATDRNDSKTVPIFAMTANVFKEDMLESAAHGMNEHIKKPLDLELLLAKMSTVL